MKFSVIGSGRVASHLTPSIIEGGMECVGICSRTPYNSEALAQKIGTKAFSSLSELIHTPVDFVLISVNDDAIPELASQFPRDFQSVVLHTSGSTPMDALSPLHNRGVLYPMQTFSKEREINMPEVPIFIEYFSPEAEQVLKKVTQVLGTQKVTALSSEERAKLHLASVFGCNFVNHLYAQADEVLHSIGLDFTILKPLVVETLNKALHNPPKSVQTGPAVRNDQKTILRHLQLLKGQPKTQKLYQELSDSIRDF